MGLTPDEVTKIDSALEALKRTLKDDFSASPKDVLIDDAFLKQVAEKYLSATGIVRLLADARLHGGKRASCTCGCSCAEPSKGLIWY